VKRVLQNTLINGVIYLGSVYLYSFFVNTLFGGGLSLSGSENQLLNVLIIVLRGFIGIIYNVWLMFIYIVAMTLSTFWVQDIFDELMQIRLSRSTGQAGKIKDPAKML
jgi:hypothetical protein